MDIQQLRHFLATVKYANLHVAAEKLHITQSGLSRSIKALERALGLPLFSRTARGVEPTSYGATLLPWAQSIVNQRERVLSEFRNLQQARSGALRIGVTFNFAEYMAPRLIVQLRRQKPGLEVSLVVGSLTELTTFLENADLDFIFGVVRAYEHDRDMCYDPLRSSLSGVFCRPQHPLAIRGTADAAELASAEWALISSSLSRSAFRDYFSSRGLPPPHVGLYTNSLPALLGVVRETDVVTNLPEQLVAADVACGALAQLRADAPVGHASIGFLYRRSQVVTPAMQVAMELIRGFGENLYPAARDSAPQRGSSETGGRPAIASGRRKAPTKRPRSSE